MLGPHAGHKKAHPLLLVGFFLGVWVQPFTKFGARLFKKASMPSF